MSLLREATAAAILLRSDRWEAIQQLAEHGWPLRFRHPRLPDGRCACGDRDCHKAGQHWLDPRPSADLATLNAWFEACPDADLLLDLGGAHLVALEVPDIAAGAVVDLSDHASDTGELGTIGVRGEGRTFHLFELPAAAAVAGRHLDGGLLLHGIDDQLPVPPVASDAAEGLEWLAGCGPDERSVAPLPAWLARYLGLTGGAACEGAAAAGERGTSRVRARIECENVPHSAPGGRSNSESRARPRKRALPVIPGGVPDAAPVEIDDVEREIRTRVRRVFQDPRLGETLIITAPPGAGKTSAILAEAARASGTVWHLGPRHELFTPGHTDAGFVRIEPRGKANCRYAPIAAPLGRKGYPIDRELCRRCELERRCGYYDQFRDSGHRFAALQQFFTSYPQGAAVVVLDEVTPSHLLEATTVPYAELSRLSGDLESGRPLELFAKVLRDALHRRFARRRGATPGGASAPELQSNQAEPPAALRGPALLAALEQAANGELERRVLAVLSIPSGPDTTLADLTPRAAEELPDTAIYRLASALKDELEWHDAGKGGGVVTLDPVRKEYRVLRRRALPEWLAEKPLIILNATADPALLTDLLGRDRDTLDVYDPPVDLPAEATIIQLTDVRYGKTTLVGGRARGPAGAPGRRTVDRALDRVRSVLDPALSTGLITFQDIEQTAATALGIPEGHTAHYGAETGTNAFQDLEQLIVLGTYNLPLDTIVEQACAINASRAPLDLTWDYQPAAYAGYRDDQGQGRAIDVIRFRDPLLRALHAERCEGVLLQAAHRLRLYRPNGRRRVQLILATAQPVPPLPPTVLVPDTTGSSRGVATTETLAAALVAVVEVKGYAAQADVARAAGVQRSQVTRHWKAILERTGYATETRRVPTGATTRMLVVAVRPSLVAETPQGEGALLPGREE